MPRFDLNLLSALDALLSERHVTKAADRLNVSQPTMSGMLQRLRYQFDDQLLVRVGRQLELTPVGETLVGPVREALLKVQALMSTGPQFDPSTNTRTFTILASDYCILTFLKQVVSRLAELAPFIRLDIKPIATPIEQLIEGNVDLVISADDWRLYHRNARADILNSETLFSDDFVCVVDNGHPISDTPTIEQFTEYPHVSVQLHGDTDTVLDHTLRERVPDFRSAYTVADFMMIPRMVAGTRLIGVVQRRLANLVADALPIRQFEPPFEIHEINETLFWHARYEDDPAHFWMRELLINEARAMRQGPLGPCRLLELKPPRAA